MQPKQYSATSDADGRFQIDDVMPGRYDISADHPGFIQSGSRKQSALILQPGQAVVEVVVRMQPAAVITGKIVDVDGDPMSNVGVSAQRMDAAGRSFRAHDFGAGSTNDLGEFRIPDLRPGRYTVTAAPPQGMRVPHPADKNTNNENVVYTTTYYPGTPDKQQAVPVELHPGDEAPINFGVLYSAAYRVSGTLAGIPKGAPLAEIILSSKEQGRVQDQQLEDGGKFDFRNVLPGSYTGSVMVVTGLSSGGSPGMEVMRIAEPIEVTTSDLEGLRLGLTPAGDVRGRFRMDTGQNFDWTQLNTMLLPVDEVSNISERFPNMVSVNKDGTFDLKNVSGGTYQLMVTARGNNLADYFTKSVNLNGRDASDGFTVGAATFLEVVVSANGAVIEGKVIDERGKPVAYATVVDVPAEHRSRSDLYQRDTTGEDGHFSLKGLNPGKYTVLAFDELEDDLRKPEFLKSYQSRGETVDLDEGSRSSVVLKVIESVDQEP
jgi:protocatechuate 3,4-dioxygenase beta subunit